MPTPEAAAIRKALNIVATECAAGLYVYGVGHEEGRILPTMAPEKAAWLDRATTAAEFLADLIAVADDPDFNFPTVRRQLYVQTDEFKHAAANYEERKAVQML